MKKNKNRIREFRLLRSKYFIKSNGRGDGSEEKKQEETDSQKDRKH
jgi:hypothetical protein